MSTEYYRLRYAISECEARRWPVTLRNIRLIDALGIDELILVCSRYGVDATGRAAPTRPWPKKRQINSWPLLGRQRRILEMLYASNENAQELRASGAWTANAPPEVPRLLAELFAARRCSPQSPPESLIARAEEMLAREKQPPAADSRRPTQDDPGSRALFTALFDRVGSEESFPMPILEACVDYALKAGNVPNDREQLVSVLAAWRPLTDPQIASFFKTSPDVLTGSEPCTGSPSISLLPPLYACLLDCYFLLEQDSETLALALTAAGIPITRGAVQTLLNEALGATYRSVTDAPFDGRVRRFFMGPIAAADEALKDGLAKTLMCLVYHLGNAEERHLSGRLNCELPGIPQRTSEYARDRAFTAISEARPDKKTPALPEVLIPLIVGFRNAAPAERTERTQVVRTFFDARLVPLHPNDLNGRAKQGTHAHVDAANQSVAQALATWIGSLHLASKELALASRGTAPAGRLAREHLADHPRGCSACREALEFVTANSSAAVGAADIPDTAAIPDTLEPSDRHLLERLVRFDVRATPSDDLITGFGALKAKLDTVLVDLVDDAETAARHVLGDVFDAWLNDGVVAGPEVLQGSSGGVLGAAPIAEAHAQMPEAASSAEPILFQTRDQRSNYSLYVREIQLRHSWFTTISCVGPRVPPKWGFRLQFEVEDELTALEERGVQPLALGILRATSGAEPERWRCLLDLLLPCRYGTYPGDPIFAKRLYDEGVEGRLPGMPREVSFWVLEG